MAAIALLLSYVAEASAAPTEAACPPNPPGAMVPAGLAPLSAADLVRRVRGMRLRYADLDPQVADAKAGERFDADGGWTWEGGRAEETGRYEIVGNQIVIRRAGQTSCRTLYLADDDKLYISIPGHPLQAREVISSPVERGAPS